MRHGTQLILLGTFPCQLAVSFLYHARCPMATIYIKTADGQNEIETRARRLTPRARSTLILVDGKRSDSELAKLVQQADGKCPRTYRGVKRAKII